MLEVIGDEATQKDIIEEIKSLNNRIIKIDSENCNCYFVDFKNLNFDFLKTIISKKNFEASIRFIL